MLLRESSLTNRSSTGKDVQKPVVAWVRSVGKGPSERKNFAFTVIAQIFVRDLISYISYLWRKVRNLVAYENHTRIQVCLTPPSLYGNF